MEFYKETELKGSTIGRIPATWEVRTLIDTVGGKDDLIVAGPFGSNLKVVDYRDEGIPIIRLQNVEYGKFVNKDIKYTSFEKAEALSYHSFVKGDIVLAKLGDPIGKTCIVPDFLEKGIVVADVVRIRINEKMADKRYIMQVLNSEIVSSQLTRGVIGTTRPRVNLNQVRDLLIPICPISEQHSIAEVLSAVDFAIQKTEEVIAKTERLKNGLMQQLLIKGIGHKEFKDTEIGKMPKEWKVHKLNYLIEKSIITYHLDGNHGELYPRAREFVSEGVPFLSANMISNGDIDFSKAKYVTEERARQFRKGIAKDGDVLLAHNATVGPVAILKTDLPYVILGTTLTSYRCNSSYLTNQYLRRYMEGPFFQHQLQRIMKQTTRNQVPITAQRKLQFIVPTLDEQQRIAEPLNAVEEKLELERNEKRKMKRIKQGLMDLLLTGKVRVKVD